MQGGAISTVEFLQYPNTHQTSVLINSQALPILQSEAIQAQSANVNIVSGATFTSQAYQASLANALSQAVNPNAAVAPAQPQNATSTPPAAAPYVIRHREDDGGWDD